MTTIDRPSLRNLVKQRRREGDEEEEEEVVADDGEAFEHTAATRGM